jgi:uncharacterized iron-regulated membrane protein
MGVWTRFVRQPQSVWVRKALFQVHLWVGLAIGLYIVVLSVTGSALVYRNELDRYFAAPRPVFDEKRPQLSEAQVRASAAQIYPGSRITEVGTRVTRRNPTMSVTLERDGVTTVRLFDPYTGADLGDAFTEGEMFVLWVVRLHDELLFDQEGRWWNGFLSAVMTLLVMTGLVVWWPGSGRWRRSLVFRWGSGWRRFNWDLHSALGFWLFLFMLMWGVSGFYLGIPEPFTDIVDAVSDPDALEERPGDVVLTWLTRLHFGRWRTQPWLKAAWACVGLVPALMFVTGAVMWWNRVVRLRWSRSSSRAEATEDAELETAGRSPG